MKKHLNTLFVTLDGAWLGKDGEAVIVRVDKETKIRVPLHNLDGIVALGWDISCSAPLMAAELQPILNHDEDQVLFVSLGPEDSSHALRIEAMGLPYLVRSRVTIV